MNVRPRVAVVCDYPEEGWSSMDLTAEMILDRMTRDHADRFQVERVCPPFRRRASRWPVVGRRGIAFNLDRLWNRHWDYPRVLRRLASTGEGGGFDLYHLVDHSYSQLVPAVPPGRAVVTCHDLDTFRCLLNPECEPRPAWFRAMTRRTLNGLRTAAAVVCVSAATRDAILAHQLLPADRLLVVPQGIRPEFSPEPDPDADADAERLLGPRRPDAPPDLLHVGTNIARKRVDVLLDVFAAVRAARPGVRLIKAGEPLDESLARRVETLGVSDAIVHVPRFSGDSPRGWATLAAVYRRARLVLQPSEAEGFGLPVAEAMACGAPLLVSEIPVLREVAADAAVYAPVGDVAAWTRAVLTLLDEPHSVTAERRARGLERARGFSWSAHVNQLAQLYARLLEPRASSNPA